MDKIFYQHSYTFNASTQTCQKTNHLTEARLKTVLRRLYNMRFYLYFVVRADKIVHIPRVQLDQTWPPYYGYHHLRQKR